MNRAFRERKSNNTEAGALTHGRVAAPELDSDASAGLLRMRMRAALREALVEQVNDAIRRGSSEQAANPLRFDPAQIAGAVAAEHRRSELAAGRRPLPRAIERRMEMRVIDEFLRDGPPRFSIDRLPATTSGLRTRDRMSAAPTVLRAAGEGGIGLDGPGAVQGARAVLQELCDATRTGTPVDVLTTRYDVPELFGRCQEASRWLRLSPDFDDTLHDLEVEALRRARVRADRSAGARSARDLCPLVLVATPEIEGTRRLRSILETGTSLGLLGILLHRYETDRTITVLSDGRIDVGEVSPLRGLSGAYLFTGADDPTGTLTVDLAQHATAQLTPDVESITVADSAPSTRAADSTADMPKEKAPDQQMAPGSGARSAASRVGESPLEAKLRLHILGRTRLFHAASEHDKQEITATLKGRQRELMVALAVHPDGVSRDALVDMVWPRAADSSRRAANTLHTTLSRLRHAISDATTGEAGDITLVEDGRYRLDPARVVVDYWRLCDAVTAYRTATTEADRIDASRSIVDAYRGELGKGIDADWMTTPREAARRDAVDAVDRLARAADVQPHETLALLEIACTFDPYSEAIYRDVMAVQRRLGHTDAIARTLAMLQLRLAEIDQRPSHETIALAESLQRASSDLTTLGKGNR